MKPKYLQHYSFGCGLNVVRKDPPALDRPLIPPMFVDPSEFRDLVCRVEQLERLTEQLRREAAGG